MAIATTSGAGAAELAGSEWRPVEIGSVQVPAGAELFVRFGGEGKLEGHGGCNRFFGSYELAVDRVEIPPERRTSWAPRIVEATNLLIWSDRNPQGHTLFRL